MRARCTTLLTVFALLAFAGCGRQWIESGLYDDELRVRNTEDNAALTDLMQAYSDALEALDMDAVRALVSEEYYENGGTTDTTMDDYGQEGLAPMLSIEQQVKFVMTRQRFEQQVREMIRDEKRSRRDRKRDGRERRRGGE